MERNDVLTAAKQDPRFAQAADQITARLMESGISADMVGQMTEVIEYALENPDSYTQLRAHAVQKGLAREEDLPLEFNQQFLIVMLLALYEAEEQLSAAPPQEFACGGLARHGRGGDTMLAHINSREAEVLRRMGGSGTVNPNTGLREFKGGGFEDIVSIAAPIAVDYFTGGMGGGILGGALTGGLTSALTGGDAGKGLISGALGGGLGKSVGGWAGDLMGGLSEKATGVLGNALVGGAGAALQGQNALQGATRGALGSLAGGMISGLGGEGALGVGLEQAGQTFGNALTAGYTPQQSLAGGALAGLAGGLRARGQTSSEGFDGLPSQSGPVGRGANSTKVMGSMGGNTTNSDSGFLGSGVSGGKLLSAAPMMLTLLQGAETPQQVTSATNSMSPEQREYFNRASQQWDWAKMQKDAAALGMGLGQYMAKNWNNVTGGQYVKKAAGGEIRLMNGGGSGRDDTIEARLSDGEYVFDAETVALLGDGSVKEGARRLDDIREKVRRHKGKSLVEGKISPNAKSPLAYLKEAA